MFNLGTQYYRAPFPEEKYWEDDFRRMSDSGLNCVQLWVLWGWVESKPGSFVFDDYDRLLELADKNRLGVVLSTIAEIHPYWIHREVPGSEMISNNGRKIVSGNRCEVHFGLTPGGCTDVPAVWERMARFLKVTALRYKDAPALIGWDAWNELRWNVHAGEPVCYCEHSLGRFRSWLDEKYGGLDALNKAWKRRYGQWDEVLPGKDPGRPYTEMMAWEHFLTWKACQHAKLRYNIIKGIDPDHPVTVHGGAPSPGYSGGDGETPLDRGNDWFFADDLDGVGCSSFPKWFNIDDADFGMRVEFVKSAARDKRVWLSEIQGGRASQGFEVHLPVDALSQQRWIWNGLACGADTLLFWCWRDEVFGRESAGYGLIGLDGLAEERMDAMRQTGRLLTEHEVLFDAYRPDKPSVGVLFSPQSYYYHYAQEGNGRRAARSLNAYCRGLLRRSIPFTVVEEEHLDGLSDLKILFLPRSTALSRETEDALCSFVQNGGTLVAESECGAFDPAGLYSYPEDRFLARLAGVKEIGRRHLEVESVPADLGGTKIDLGLSQWCTPMEIGKGTVHASCDDGALLLEVPVSKGRVIFCGSYPGEACKQGRTAGFEEYLSWAVRKSGWTPDAQIIEPQVEAESFLYIKCGSSQGRRVVFVFFQEGHAGAHLRFRSGFFSANKVTDIISGCTHELASGPGETSELRIANTDWRFAVLVEDA